MIEKPVILVVGEDCLGFVAERFGSRLAPFAGMETLRSFFTTSLCTLFSASSFAVPFVGLALVGLVGCAVEVGEEEIEVDQIRNGDPTTRMEVAKIIHIDSPSYVRGSGVLIHPSLLLTTQTALLSSATVSMECQGRIAARANTVPIWPANKLGVMFNGEARRVASIWRPNGFSVRGKASVCGADIAVLRLQRPVTTIAPSPLLLTAVSMGSFDGQTGAFDPQTAFNGYAVGYGIRTWKEGRRAGSVLQFPYQAEETSVGIYQVQGAVPILDGQRERLMSPDAIMPGDSGGPVFERLPARSTQAPRVAALLSRGYAIFHQNDIVPEEENIGIVTLVSSYAREIQALIDEANGPL